MHWLLRLAPAGIAALGFVAASLGTSAAAQQSRSEDTKWAVCAFDVSDGSHLSMLLFEPFPIAADKEDFSSITKVFRDEVGVGSILPGYDHLTDYVIGHRRSDGCAIFPSEGLAREKYESSRRTKGYWFIKTVDWRPSDEFTGLAKGRQVKTELAGETQTKAPQAEAVTAPDAAEEAAKLHEQREAEWQAKLDAYAAEKADWEAKVAAQKAEEERQKSAHEAAKQAAAREKAAHEAKMAAHRRQVEAANLRQQEYEAARRRHLECLSWNKQACDEIAAGKPAEFGQQVDAGEASTDTDATTCVSQPVLSSNAAFEGNTAATVVNGCKTPVDVKICLMREGGWNCGAVSGLQPQDRWSHSSFKTTGQVFWDAKVVGSSKSLGNP